MTKNEFLARLGDLLACLPKDQIEETKAFYAEVIDDRMEDGMTEDEAVAAIGSPGAVAEAILDDLPAVPRAIAKTKRRSTALLWTLVIVGSPLWVSLGLAFLAFVAAVYITIWALALCIWIVAVALVAVGPALWIVAFGGMLVGNFPFSLVMTGVGLAFFGVGLLCCAAALAASKQIARLSVLWVNKARSPFKKDDGHGGMPASRRSDAADGVDAAPVDGASAQRLFASGN